VDGGGGSYKGFVVMGNTARVAPNSRNYGSEGEPEVSKLPLLYEMDETNATIFHVQLGPRPRGQGTWSERPVVQ